MDVSNEETKGTIKFNDLRLACKQFAMLYFHFCKVLTNALGEEKAFVMIQETIFRLSLDRTDRARGRAVTRGIETIVENFSRVNDLPSIAWTGWKPEMGGVCCPYAEVWLEYFIEDPWFKRFASLYCDVIDTTNIENFTKTISQRITKNLLWGDPYCDREYFESDKVKQGKFSYGK